MSVRASEPLNVFFCNLNLENRKKNSPYYFSFRVRM